MKFNIRKELFNVNILPLTIQQSEADYGCKRLYLQQNCAINDMRDLWENHLPRLMNTSSK